MRFAVVFLCSLLALARSLRPAPAAAAARFGRRGQRALSSAGSSSPAELEGALGVLAAFDEAYIARMKKGRAEGKSPFAVEFDRAQLLKSDGLLREREQLREATKAVAAVAAETTLGIKAESGLQGLAVLRNWVSGLSLTRGVLRAVDENNQEVAVGRWDDSPVYIKYNSTEGGDAYMKPYEGGYGGVIFQPKLDDGVFRQYGDLPVAVHGA